MFNSGRVMEPKFANISGVIQSVLWILDISPVKITAICLPNASPLLKTPHHVSRRWFYQYVYHKLTRLQKSGLKCLKYLFRCFTYTVQEYIVGPRGVKLPRRPGKNVIRGIQTNNLFIKNCNYFDKRIIKKKYAKLVKFWNLTFD